MNTRVSRYLRLGAIVLTMILGVLAPSFTAAGAPATHRISSVPNGETQYCKYTTSQPLLVEGSPYHTAVKQAQCELNWAYAYYHNINFGNGGYNGLTVDGQFGANTLAATKDFQGCAGITVDGQIGPQTWSKLNYYANINNPYC